MANNLPIGNKSGRPQPATSRTPATSRSTKITLSPTGYGLVYGCSLCGKSFKSSSLLVAHEREHGIGLQARSTQRRDLLTVEVVDNRCRFCDRKFDLARTLHIHQLQHCAKITPQERRKLRYNELCHEGRAAPLPKFQRDAPTAATRSTAGAATLMLPATAATPSSSSSASSSSRPEKFRDFAALRNMCSSSSIRCAKPKAAAQKFNKLIPCCMCKLSFETLGELNAHTRSMHGRDHKTV